MVASYPEALRWRILYLLYGEGLQVKEICGILKVSKTFVNKVIGLYQRNLSVAYKIRRGGRPRKLDGE